MAAKFQGKWVDDPSVPRVNFDELMDKVGVDAALKEKLKTSTGTVEYNIEGDKVTIKSSSTAFPGNERVYSFTPGVPFDDIGMDGSPFKATVTVTGDNTMTDSGKNEKYGEFEATRTVDGNVMKCTTKMAGITMTYQMKRA
uniref:Uncharacterized protein n=1 Tax=Pinctada fucata TaxID=50426 RepID=A0A194AL98_PINFU